MATYKGFLLVFAILLAAAFVVASADEKTRELAFNRSIIS
jgi:hypothetical protein